MADFIKIDTNAVKITAAKIEGYNIMIRNDFSSAEAAVKALNGSWSGSAAGNAINAFHSIKATYFDSRYVVMDNFVRFLRQVETGYTKTEGTVYSNAERFK